VPTHLLSEGTHDSNQKINKLASYNGKVQVVAKAVALLSRRAAKDGSIKKRLLNIVVGKRVFTCS
jgi:hypothetical protein